MACAISLHTMGSLRLSARSLAKPSLTSVAGPSRYPALLAAPSRPSSSQFSTSTHSSNAISATGPSRQRPSTSTSNAATPSAGGPQDPLAYCSSLVQRLDPEAYLTSYFWGKRERAWFLAWRAFNVSGHGGSRTGGMWQLALDVGVQ
jgi:hypothetical protein